MKADTIRQKSIDAPNYSMAFWLKEIAAQLAELNEHLKARPGQVHEEPTGGTTTG